MGDLENQFRSCEKRHDEALLGLGGRVGKMEGTLSEHGERLARLDEQGKTIFHTLARIEVSIDDTNVSIKETNVNVKALEEKKNQLSGGMGVLVWVIGSAMTIAGLLLMGWQAFHRQ